MMANHAVTLQQTDFQKIMLEQSEALFGWLDNLEKYSLGLKAELDDKEDRKHDDSEEEEEDSSEAEDLVMNFDEEELHKLQWRIQNEVKRLRKINRDELYEAKSAVRKVTKALDDLTPAERKNVK